MASLSEKIKLVGVTGTNGKTTIAPYCLNYFQHLGYKCGLISTVQNQVGDKILPSTHTTPDAITLNKLIAEMVADGCSHIFMEVSSHAISPASHCGLAVCRWNFQQYHSRSFGLS